MAEHLLVNLLPSKLSAHCSAADCRSDWVSNQYWLLYIWHISMCFLQSAVKWHFKSNPVSTGGAHPASIFLKVLSQWLLYCSTPVAPLPGAEQIIWVIVSLVVGMGDMLAQCSCAPACSYRGFIYWLLLFNDSLLFWSSPSAHWNLNKGNFLHSFFWNPTLKDFFFSCRLRLWDFTEASAIYGESWKRLAVKFRCADGAEWECFLWVSLKSSY